jgi:hypothetical protein
LHPNTFRHATDVRGRTTRVAVASLVIALAIPLLQASPASAALAEPTPLGPSDGATLSFPTEPPLFQWEAVAGATGYRIEIDDAPDFIGATSATTVNTAYTLTEPQTTGQSFYWHVQATSSSGSSDWSTTRSYDIAWPDSSPELVEPTDGDTVEDIAFSWDPVPGAATYQLQVSPNGDWANNVDVDVVVKGTAYSPPVTLGNASYFWRVRARDAASTPNLGDWSEEWQFTRTWSDAPTLLTPDDGVVSSVATPDLTWTPVPHASHYEVQLGEDQNFSPSTYSVCYTNHTALTYYEIETSTSPNPPGSCNAAYNEIDPGSASYWRVRGVDGSGGVLSPWSDVSTFLFRGDPSDTVTLLSPDDGDTVETPVLSWDPVTGIGKYKVTIHKPGGSTATVTTAATSWTPTSKLASSLPAGPFTWEVQTVDSYGKLGIVGDQWSFSLDPETTGGSLDQLTPADDASDIVMPSMTWTPYAGAEYYEVWYSLEGSGVESRLSGTSKLPYSGFTYAGTSGDLLAPGTYNWRVKAFDGSSAIPIATSGWRSFEVATIDEASYLGPCSTPLTPCTVKDTPTLQWDEVPGAGQYLVYIAQDADFTNIVKTYRTQYTDLTPRESLFDNQAGNAYYWFVRPCITATRCGKFDATVFDGAFAFRKLSVAVEPTSPTDGDTVSDLVTFDWDDYLSTNLADPSSPTQEAKQYRIQVSTVADFASTIDDKTVDQTTYTPYDKTYPEGTLYWRVQAIDGSNNALTRSPVWSVVKSSPKISLQAPAADVELVANLPYFTWTPQDYAAKYDLEVYENGDLSFTPSNKLLSQQTKMSAWAPTHSLDAGTYAWRIRRLDADNRPGPWSNGRKFTLSKADTSTTVDVTKTSSKIKTHGAITPALPGLEMQVTLSRRQSGHWVKLGEKTPAIKDTGGFSASFQRPASGRCKVVAKFGGDDLHKASSDSVTFAC